MSGKEYRTINGQNYFNKASFNEMRKALEAGETIRIHIDCIGHTRTEMETAHYERELTKAYGKRLEINRQGWPETYRLSE